MMGLFGFNEAEAHAPRIQRRNRNHGNAPNRFNEAEAHAPRIQVEQRKRKKFLGSFNEAEAHAPRIPNLSRAQAIGHVQASMRPRRMRLGYASIIPPASRRGKSFNEAEAHAPRIRSRAGDRKRPR